MPETLCPALDEFDNTVSPDVIEHAAGCLRCRALITALGLDINLDSVGEREHNSTLRLLRHPSEEFAVGGGDICAAVAPNVDRHLICVVITADAGVIEVAPISDEVGMATDRDLLLDMEVLGYPAMVECWNAGTLLIEEIAEVITSLDETRWDQLVGLIEAVEDGREADDFPVGPPIIGEADPRWDFHVLESDRVRPHFEGASALRGIGSFAELLRHQVERQEIEPAVLSEQLGPRVEDRESWVEDALEGRLPFAEIPKEAVGDLLIELRVPATWQVASILAGPGSSGVQGPKAEGRLVRAFRAHVRPAPKADQVHSHAADVIGFMADRQLSGDSDDESA